MAIDVIARLVMRGGEFSRGVDKELATVDNKFKAAGSRMRAAFGGAIAGAVGSIAIAGVQQAIRDSLEYASSLGETSQALGVTTRTLQEYRYAASQVGIEQGDMDATLQRLTRTIGTSPEKFSRLGISVRDATGHFRDAGDVLPQLAEAMQGMDAAERAATLYELLGRSGQKMGALLADGAAGVHQYTNAARDLGIVLTDREIQAADDAADKMGKLKTVLDARMAIAVADNADSLVLVADALTDLTAGTINFTARGITAWRQLTLEVTRYYSQLQTLLPALDAGAAGRQFGNRITINQLNRAQPWRADGYTDSSVELTSAPVTANRLPRPATRPAARFIPPAAQLYAPTPRYVSPAARRYAPTRQRNFVDDQADQALNGGAFAAPAPPVAAVRETAARRAELADQRAQSERDLADQLREQLQLQSDAQRVEAVRLEQGDAAAEIYERQADFLRQHPAAAAQTVEEFARLADLAPPLTQADRDRLQALRDQLAVVQAQSTAAVVQQQEADIAAQKAAAAADMAARAQEEAKQRAEQNFRDLAGYYESLFSGRAGDIWDDFKSQGLRAIAELAAQWTLSQLSGGGGVVGSLFSQNSAQGGLFGLLGGFLNRRGGGSAASVVKSLGGVAGKAAGATGALGAASTAMPYLAAGMAAFQLFGGLFKKTRTGSATLGFSDGQLGVGATSGNNAQRIAQATSGVNGLASTLQGIADQLGGSITGAGSVSIGTRKKKFVVDPTGRGRTKGSGTLSFDTEEEAIRAALADALRDGVVGAISDASRRILASGQTLEKAVEKAALIEAIPKALKARLDPVGAAVDDLNAKWAKTIAALKEGGASAEQMADAQKLYQLELVDAKASATAAAASLKEFLNSLNIGSNSPLSLRDQETAAAAALAPYLQQIDAGATIDQQAYQAAAQAFLDVEREINASSAAYFDEFNRIRDYTARAIAKIDNATPISPATADPFGAATADSTAAAAEILAQQSGQLANIEQILASIANAGGGVAFIGTARAFV